MRKFWHMTNYKAGHRAEKWALFWLRLKGYHLVAKNFVVGRGTGAGEVDLIVRRGKTLVFVEVKKRPDEMTALNAIRPKNQKRIERTSQVFLSRFPKYKDYEIRYDVIMIINGLPKHLPNAWRPFGLIFLLFFLGGCQMWGTMISSVHSLVGVISDDRPLDEDASDIALYTRLRERLAQRDIKSILDVQLTVFQGAVLLTGALPNYDEIAQTVEAVWQTQGVNFVYNYIRMGKTLDPVQTSEEIALSSSIRTKLALTEEIKSSNYKLVLENGTVYVMGLKKDMEEWQKARAVIADTYGVDKIVCLMQDKKASE